MKGNTSREGGVFATEIGLYGRLVCVAPFSCWPKSVWKLLLGLVKGTWAD